MLLILLLLLSIATVSNVHIFIVCDNLLVFLNSLQHVLISITITIVIVVVTVVIVDALLSKLHTDIDKIFDYCIPLILLPFCIDICTHIHIASISTDVFAHHLYNFLSKLRTVYPTQVRMRAWFTHIRQCKVRQQLWPL